MAGRRIEGLSKGYTQRVGLAAAILHGPDVLILDEPTSGLDPNQMTEIQGLIRDLSADRTILLSSHILPEIQAVASRVLILNGGELVADDTPEALGAAVSGRRLKVKTGGPDVTEVEALLAQVSGVSRVRVWREGDVICAEVFTPQEIDARDEVARAVVGANWSLLELVEARADLQEVFRQLTEGHS